MIHSPCWKATGALFPIALSLFSTSSLQAQTVEEAFPNSLNFVDYWRGSDWFGVFHTEFFPWIYREDSGWYYTVGNADSLYLYSEKFGKWVWTEKERWPRYEVLDSIDQRPHLEETLDPPSDITSLAVSGDRFAVYRGNFRRSEGITLYARGESGWAEEDAIDFTEEVYKGHTGTLAIDGDTLAFGYQTSAAGTAPSKVHVYVFTGEIWEEQAVLTEGEHWEGSESARYSFEGSIALAGDTLVVGATEAAEGAGACYVFERSSGVWEQVAHLTAFNGDAERMEMVESFDTEIKGDGFGSTVAISGDGQTIAVGAIREDGSGTGTNDFGSAGTNGVRNSGAVYVFTKENGVWNPSPHYLKPDISWEADFTPQIGGGGHPRYPTYLAGYSENAGQAFGTGVDVDGNTILIRDSRSAHLFEKDGASGWKHAAYPSNLVLEPNNGFARDSALFGNTALVGDFDANYAFRPNGSAWEHVYSLPSGTSAIGEDYVVIVTSQDALEIYSHP